VNTSLSQNVDLASEKLFKVLTKADEIQERPVAVHVDQEIEITRWTSLTARDGAEHSDISSAVLSGDFQNVVSSAVNVHGRPNLIAQLPTTPSGWTPDGEGGTPAHALDSVPKILRKTLERPSGRERLYPQIAPSGRIEIR